MLYCNVKQSVLLNHNKDVLDCDITVSYTVGIINNAKVLKNYHN